MKHRIIHMIIFLSMLLFSVVALAQDRRGVESRGVAVPAQPAEYLKNFNGLTTTGRGRGGMLEASQPEQLVSRVMLMLKKGGDAEIEFDGEMSATRLKGKWAVGEGESINLSIRQFRNRDFSAAGKVMLKNGAFSRLEINGVGLVLNFDARNVDGGTVTAGNTSAAASKDPNVGRFVVQIIVNNLVLSVRPDTRRGVVQYNNLSQGNQQWDIESVGGGYYILKSVEFNEVLSIDERARDGVTVFTAPYDKNKDSQRWQIRDAGNGQIKLVSKKGTALELTGGSADNGVKLQVWPLSSDVTQNFRLLRLDPNAIVVAQAPPQPAQPPVPQGPPEGPGSMSWRGVVDGTIQLEIRLATVMEKNIAGSPYTGSNYQFTASLPRRATSVQVSRQRGRGDVKVIQQPTDFNGFTAIVQLTDSKSGSDTYEIVVNWQ